MAPRSDNSASLFGSQLYLVNTPGGSRPAGTIVLGPLSRAEARRRVQAAEEPFVVVVGEQLSQAQLLQATSVDPTGIEQPSLFLEA